LDVTVRPPTPADAETLARSWQEGARELVELAPDRFRLPDEDGLVEFFRVDLETSGGPDLLSLVAEVDGKIAGSLGAQLHPPIASARFQVLEYLGQPRVYVNHLHVDPRYRRRGVATALMDAAERWGREKGAGSIALDTYAESPLSVPFYEAIGYERASIVFEKRLPRRSPSRMSASTS
jgi:ribosomal protein S18 acetylase RimI-like enzyme